MPNSVPQADQEMLRFALHGYELELTRIHARIAEIQAQLGENPAKPAKKGPKRGSMSVAGRAAIAAAQRKRWALTKRAKKATPAKKAPKLPKSRKTPVDNGQ